MDLKFEVPATQSVSVDEATAKAIDLGIKDAEQGRTVSLDEARDLVEQWNTKFASRAER